MPGTLRDVNDNAIVESDSSSASENMTTFATITSEASSDRAQTANTVYIIIMGGVLFVLVVIAMLGAIAGLLVKRMKHKNSITTQAEMKSKTSEHNYIDLPSKFKLDGNLESPPILESTPSEGVSEPDDPGDKLCFTRLSVSSTLTPVPAHPDAAVQDSAEHLYVTCPIMSNVYEPGATSP